jgi:hypothetical protein
VFAGLKRRDGDGGVEDRRRADPDDVEVAAAEHVGPIVDDFRDMEIGRDALGGFDARIADSYHLDVRQGEQARQMALPDNAARADQADAYFF